MWAKRFKIGLGIMVGICSCCGIPAYAQWEVTPKGGMNVTKYQDEVAGIGFKLGASVSYAFGTGRFSLQSGLYYVRRKMGDYSYAQLYGTYEDWNGERKPFVINVHPNPEKIRYAWNGSTYYLDPYLIPEGIEVEGIRDFAKSMRLDYLQLPVLARWNARVGKELTFHLAAGPFIAIGIAGRGEMSENNKTAGEELPYVKHHEWNPFHTERYEALSRFDWGISGEAGMEVRRFVFNIGLDVGLGSDGAYEEISFKYYTVGFSAGYVF